MPVYCYECEEGHRFEDFNSIENRYNAVCPTCGKEANIRISRPNMRIAYPCEWFTSDGKRIGWKPDSGITPPPGQPYPIGG